MPKRKPKARALARILAPGTNEETPWFTRGGVPVAEGFAGIPAEVTAMGQTYRVFAHGMVYADAAGKVRLLGGISPLHRMIILDASQPRAQAVATLAHELGHVYLTERQRSNRALARLTHQQVEAICDLIADILEDQA